MSFVVMMRGAFCSSFGQIWSGACFIVAVIRHENGWEFPKHMGHDVGRLWLNNLAAYIFS